MLSYLSVLNLFSTNVINILHVYNDENVKFDFAMGMVLDHTCAITRQSIKLSWLLFNRTINELDGYGQDLAVFPC